MIRLKYLGLALVALALYSHGCVYASECPECDPLPDVASYGTLLPAGSVFCVGESVAWTPEIGCAAPGASCYWSVSGFVDKDTCGDPHTIDDAWKATLSISGCRPTIADGKVTFGAPGSGTVKATVSDCGNPGCGDGGSQELSVDYYVIGSLGKPVADCQPMVYICDPNNGDNQPPTIVTAPDDRIQPRCVAHLQPILNEMVGRLE